MYIKIERDSEMEVWSEGASQTMWALALDKIWI